MALGNRPNSNHLVRYSGPQALGLPCATRRRWYDLRSPSSAWGKFAAGASSGRELLEVCRQPVHGSDSHPVRSSNGCRRRPEDLLGWITSVGGPNYYAVWNGRLCLRLATSLACRSRRCQDERSNLKWFRANHSGVWGYVS